MLRVAVALHDVKIRLQSIARNYTLSYPPLTMEGAVQLFSATGDAISQILPTSFADEHQEARIQSWADLSPALINEGRPMTSLGREILTKNIWVRARRSRGGEAKGLSPTSTV